MDDTPSNQAPLRTQSPHCRFCGYELSGIQAQELCPECSQPVWESNSPVPTSGRSIAALIFAILGVQPAYSLFGTLITVIVMNGGFAVMGTRYFLFPALELIFFGLFALIYSSLSLRQLKQKTRAEFTRGFSVAARILGWIEFILGICLFALILYPVFAY
jgi:hypothetical protein